MLFAMFELSEGEDTRPCVTQARRHHGGPHPLPQAYHSRRAAPLVR